MPRSSSLVRLTTIALLVLSPTLSACSDGSDTRAPDTRSATPNGGDQTASESVDQAPDKLPPIPRGSFVGDMTSVEKVNDKWEIDSEIKTSRDAAIRKVNAALTAAGFTSLKPPASTGEYLSSSFIVQFTVGVGQSTTPVHYTVSARTF